MYVYQIAYAKDLELVQPSECVPNLSYHRGHLVQYHCRLPRHNSNTEIELHHFICARFYVF